MLGRHKVLGKMLGKRGLKAEGRAGGKTGRGQSFWTDIRREEGHPRSATKQILLKERFTCSGM